MTATQGAAELLVSLSAPPPGGGWGLTEQCHVEGRHGHQMSVDVSGTSASQLAGP